MWYYNNKKVDTLEAFPENTFGFVYCIEHIPTGKKYIGRKQLMMKKTSPPLKGQKRKRRSIVEGNWKDYYGSNLEIKKLIKEGKQSEFKREILEFAPTKKLLNYYELRWLFLEDVLNKEEYYNDNIAGKFYRRDFLT